MRLRSLLVLIAAGCGGGGPALSHDTVLSCPHPSALPFALASRSFKNSDSKTSAKTLTRIKDQSADVLGNPGGKLASIYIADADAPAAGSVAYAGVKARSGDTQGFDATPIAGEEVSVWHYDSATTAWQKVGQTTTDATGNYSVPAGGIVPSPGDPVYALLDADQTCAVHYDYLLPAGTKVVVTDIDGTLTTDDQELIKQLGDDTYVPKMVTSADALTKAWAVKGYPVIYLTARPHLFRGETRGWLADLGFAPGPVITAKEIPKADIYKTLWLNRMITDFGWEVVAAYGNADTDITAYNNAAIPKSKTFIVGPLAGSSGTVAIDNLDYTSHISSYVGAQPNQ